jgi:diamine N-acetyltransferase
MWLDHKDFFLRELTRQDLARVNTWRNDPNVIQWLASPFRFVNIETDESWFEGYQRNRHCQVRVVIVSRHTGEPVGMANLLRIDWVAKSAEFGVQIGAAAEWGRGLGTWVVRAMVQHAFDNLNLHRVYLTVLPNNRRALRIYEKVGFQREGILRQALFKDGQYQDLVMMSVLREEFPPVEGSQAAPSVGR